MSSSLLDRKLEYWEHQLLDLGKRNKMINYRETKRSTLKLIEPSFDALFQRLAVNEEALTFQRPIDRETDVRVFSILSLLENLSAPLPVSIGDIKAEGSILDRQKTLRNIRSKARLALEEQGTNILYLSFGFIEWRDGKGASAQWIKSPLILVPTVLTLDSLRSPYTLSRHEDDIVVNPTLQYYLKSEYGVDLPNFDSDKETIQDYFHRLEKLADLHGWRILKEVSLGLLSFLKISMYKDLVQNEERIKTNPVIRALAGDCDTVNDIPDHLRSFNLDSILPQDCYQVLSADSSQQDAILYSKNNISFVMQGPPGTGKSQTITNIIAEALADGKKVLFVSEKMAALQVVYRRLQEVHLADFCLPLHSYKANKKEILDQLGANLNLNPIRVRDSAVTNLEQLMTLRQELNQYASELHQQNPDLNLSIYEVYSKLEDVLNAPSVSFSLPDPLTISQGQLQGYLNKLDAYTQSLQRIQYQLKNNPWEGLKSRTAGFEFTEKMEQELSLAQSTFHEILGICQEIRECPGLSEILSYEDLQELSESIQTISALPVVPSSWLESSQLVRIAAEAEKLKADCEKLHFLEDEVSHVFTGEIHHFRSAAWKESLSDRLYRLTQMPYVTANSTTFFLENHKTLQKNVNELRTDLDRANTVFDSINSLLGTRFAFKSSSLVETATLLALIRSNLRIPAPWFRADLGKYKAFVTEAKGNAARLMETKTKILSEWEPEILSLDYEPILQRYKTEYTGFFKIFNAQYKQDQRALQAMSKGLIGKMRDDVAASLLLNLKAYHDQLAWFEMNSAALSSILSIYDQNVDTDWDQVLSALDTAEKLVSLPASSLPDSVKLILSRDHSEEIGVLEQLYDSASAAYTQIHSLEITSGIDLGMDQLSFSGKVAQKQLSLYLETLDEISDQMEELSPYLLIPNLSAQKIYHALECLDKQNTIQKNFFSNATVYKEQFGALFRDRYTDWSSLLALLNQLEKLQQLKLYDRIKPLVNVSTSRKEEFIQLSARLSSACAKTTDAMDWLSSQFDSRRFSLSQKVDILAEKIHRCLEHSDMLNGWMDYQEAKEDCFQHELGDFITKIERQNLYQDYELNQIFLKGFYTLWLEAISGQSASVRRFRKPTQEERISQFSGLDDLQLLIAQMRIREKLIRNLPSDHQLLKATDELSILRRELGKKRNIMPLRKLFRQIPNLLLRLKPCLMMSPLSVSYFLETESYHFDLVIFDEASQIFPEDSIGAIFRGSQVVIAGDSKQLPPTNFFAATTNNLDPDYDHTEEDDFSEVISDSILEESASALPNRTLRWHYRSKHENLIAFSNREIYDNNLITFPSSADRAEDMGVEYIYVEDGVYEGKGKNCNLQEARKCVELVEQHIRKHPDRSLGIIAFSEKQQNAIENAIIDFREEHPEYEWFFNDSQEDPFFVKNLENVQGDERDTILFSICYAKDPDGKMYMRFGPLGHEGGERRLNVAITRAKCNIKLVGSILPSDIDLNRTNSAGIRMLKSYIEFARHGSRVLKPVDQTDAFSAKDDFCQIIADFLTIHGYQVVTNVGCSDYKIDIAVVNPSAEGEYIAGIECDGLSYVQARTARERDHLRSSILQNMGWNLYRVWSTEWVRNPYAEGQALLLFLHSLIGKNGETLHIVKKHPDDGTSVSMDQITSESDPETQESTPDNPYHFSYYQTASIQDVPSDPQDSAETRIIKILRYVVHTEQPMPMELLYKRMASCFNITGRVTESVKTTVDVLIASHLSHEFRIDRDSFIRTIPEMPIRVRIPQNEAQRRPMESIHTEEVAAAMIAIMKKTFGLTVDDLSIECARVFGYEHMGPKIKQKTDAAVDYLIHTYQVKLVDGKVQLV